MRAYMRPEFYVTEFMPDEYIAACEKETQEVVTLECDCGAKISSTVKATSSTNGQISLDDGSTIFLDAWSGADNILVFRTGTASGGTMGDNGCHMSAYQVGYPGSAAPPMVGDQCLIYGDSGALLSTAHHHAKVTSVSNFS